MKKGSKIKRAVINPELIDILIKRKAKKKTNYLFVLIIILVFLLSVGAMYRFSLSQYEEECYQYKQIQIEANYTISYSSPCFLYCITCKCGQQINYTVTYNTTTNGQCIKYILVRNV